MENSNGFYGNSNGKLWKIVVYIPACMRDTD